jgi:hypothetical protein
LPQQFNNFYNISDGCFVCRYFNAETTEEKATVIMQCNLFYSDGGFFPLFFKSTMGKGLNKINININKWLPNILLHL